MSAAPVSRSSALPEITLPSRRSFDGGEREQSFTLPAEPADRPRPRLDDDRSARDGTQRRDQAKPDDGARSTQAADARSSARADDAGKDRTAAGASETSDKTKADAGADQASTKDTAAAEGKKTEAAASDKPADGQTVEDRKAVLAAALDGAPVIGKGTPEEQAAAGAVMQPPAPPAVSAEFLALAAAAIQGGEPAKPEGAATAQDKSVAATGETGAATQSVGNTIAVPVPPALPARGDGQTSAGGEAAAADIKAGLTPQLPAAGTETKADAKSGEAKSGDAQQGDAKTAEVKTADTPSSAKDNTEAGKTASATTGSDAKATGEVKAADSSATGQTTQTGSTESTGGQQANAPLSPQAILAAGPQSLAKPQPPLSELDAAAQATAHAQAEAAAKTASAESSRPTPLHVVPIEIGARALAGNKRFDIRLDPAELGRIDVSLEISDSGDVSAKLTVDRVETLQMLQRDARTLERAFEQAGLKPSEGGIDMSLRDSSDQSGSRQQQRQDDEAPRGRRAWVQTSEDSALVTDVVSRSRGSRLGGVDLSI